MRFRIDCCVEQGLKQIGKELLKVRNDTICVIDITEREDNRTGRNIEYSCRRNPLESRYLHHPSHTSGIHGVLRAPFREFIPFVRTLPIDRETRLSMLIFTIFKVGDHFLSKDQNQHWLSRTRDAYFQEVSKEDTIDIVISFEKDFTKRRKNNELEDRWSRRAVYRSILWPTGLYLALNRSKRWKVFRS